MEKHQGNECKPLAVGAGARSECGAGGITKESLSACLNGSEYRKEVAVALEVEAKLAGLVIVFGASDDLMEFRGAIHDELDSYEGTTAYLNGNGLLQNDCENDECPHFAKMKSTVKTIDAVWNRDGYSWVFDTSIPHATFEVMEDGDKYCRGIVFQLKDAS